MEHTEHRDALGVSFGFGGNLLCICYVDYVEVESESSTQRRYDLFREINLPFDEVVGGSSQHPEHCRWKDRRHRVSSQDRECFPPYGQDTALFVGEHYHPKILLAMSLIISPRPNSGQWTGPLALLLFSVPIDHSPSINIRPVSHNTLLLGSS